MNTVAARPETATVLWALIGAIALSLFLQDVFATRQAVLFLIGIGLGITLMHAMFGFTGAWRSFVRERRSAGIRAQLLLVGLTSILFFPILAKLFPGIHASGAMGQVGLSVLVGAFLFGIGMQLGGGCGSGTLFTVGKGHVNMLVTMLFFIVGATVASAHLGWWLALPNLGKVSIIEAMGWLPALAVQLAVLAGLFYLVRYLEQRRHGGLSSLGDFSRPEEGYTQRLVFGPWPLWWAVIALALLNLATMLVAGHPWSITFAFGLWGAKAWAALGGEPGMWTYWSSGYPARALNSSVLADTTSLMNFGIILGAMLAAALAGKYAPEHPIKRRQWLAAVIGGLLLGYGARLAFGCNIGGLLAGISSGSLHGWLWLVAGFTGSALGVRLRVMMKLDTPVSR